MLYTWDTCKRSTENIDMPAGICNINVLKSRLIFTNTDGITALYAMLFEQHVDVELVYPCAVSLLTQSLRMELIKLDYHSAGTV